jgi:hypothetical protein
MAQIEIRKGNPMGVRTFMRLLAVVTLGMSGAAFAMGARGGADGASSAGGAGGAHGGTVAQGSTSGPAAGTNVEPSTVTQKQNTGRSAASERELHGSSSAAGAPAIEGNPGTQSGTHEGQKNPSQQ